MRLINEIKDAFPFFWYSRKTILCESREAFEVMQRKIYYTDEFLEELRRKEPDPVIGVYICFLIVVALCLFSGLIFGLLAWGAK